MTPQSGWPGLFWTAFKQSRNAMVVIDEHRIQVEVNGAYLQLVGYPRRRLVGHPLYEFVAKGPLMSADEFKARVARGEFAGSGELMRSDGRTVVVQYAAHAEKITGRELILVVALATTRPGRRTVRDSAAGSLSERELEIVRLVGLGWSGPEIASDLQISHNTVRTHIAHAMTKLGARSRAHLVAKSLGDGLVLT